MHTTTNTRQYGLFVAQSPTGRVVNVRRPVTPAPAPRAVEPYQIPVAPAGDWVPYGTPAANATAPTAPAGPLPGYLGDDGGEWEPYLGPAS